MSDEHQIVQTASLASGNTQIGVQNNYTGLAIGDAVQMAFSMMKEYYPQFKEEALADLHEMLIRELDKMKPKAIVPPTPKTAIPVLQNAAITDEVEIREIYAKLLASSMNEELVSSVHPSFVNIVNQLSTYDAKVLKIIKDIHDSIPLARVIFTFDSKYLTSILPHFFSPYFDRLNDRFATSFSIENLARLNLVNLFEGNVINFDYNTIKEHPYIKERFEFAKAHNPNRTLEINLSKYVIQENDYGKKFLKICLPE